MMISNMGPKWMKLEELLAQIPDDEFVIVFDYSARETGYREEDAIYNGQVADWWDRADAGIMRRRVVLGFQARELETVVGPVIMIVVE